MAKICPGCRHASGNSEIFCSWCGRNLPATPDPDKNYLDVNFRDVPENEILFAALGRDVAGAVFLVDPGLRFTYSNYGLYWQIGIHPTTCKGKTFAESGLPEHIVMLWNNAFREVFSSGEPRDLSFRHPSTGTLIRLRLSPVPAPDRSIRQVLATTRPAFSLQEEAMSMANRRMRLLLGLARDEILNRHQVISMLLHELQAATDPAKKEEWFRKLNVVLDGLRDVSDMLIHNLDVIPRELGWQDTDRILASIPVPQGIILERVAPLPEIFADTGLERVFTSLLAYAAQHGGTVTRVRVSAEETPNGCRILFEDNGAGVPAEKKNLLFREPRLSMNEGWDLFTAAEILDNTRIAIRETGLFGKGARFEILVPRGSYRVAGIPDQPDDPPATSGVSRTAAGPAPELPGRAYRFTLPPAPEREPLVPDAPAPAAPVPASRPPAPVTRQENPGIPAASVIPGASGPGNPAYELRKSREQFSHLADETLDAVMLFDRDLRFVYGNKAFLHATGLLFLTALQKPVREMGFAGYLVPRWEEALTGVIDSGTSRFLEYPDEYGEKRCWLLLPVRGPDNAVIQVLALDRPAGTMDGYVNPATRQYLRTNILARYRIREQAGALKSLLDLCDADADAIMPADFRRSLRTITDTISEQLSASSSPASDGIGEHSRWVDVAAVLARLKIPPGLSVEAASPLPVIYADEWLPEVFSVLVENTALHGGHATRVRIHAETGPEGCVIVFEDNGTGIPADAKERIFTHLPAFYPCGQRAGSLEIARNVLGCSEITIRETGIPGEGARFELVVPKGSCRATRPIRPENEQLLDAAEKAAYDRISADLHSLQRKAGQVSREPDPALLKDLVNDIRQDVLDIVESVALRQMERSRARDEWKREKPHVFFSAPPYCPRVPVGPAPESDEPAAAPVSRDGGGPFIPVSRLPDAEGRIEGEAFTFRRIMGEIAGINAALNELFQDPGHSSREEVSKRISDHTSCMFSLIETEYWSRREERNRQ